MNTDGHLHPDDQRALDALDQALPAGAPPGGLRDAILAAAAETPQDAPVAPEPPMAEVIPLRPRRRGMLTTLAAAACAAAVAVAITLTVTNSGGDTTPVAASATAAIETEGPAPVRGTAALYAPDTAGGTVQVNLQDVPPAPAGHHYEVWVLPKDSTTMTAVGSFTPAGRNVQLNLPLPGPGRYAAVDISVQRNNGSPAHSGTSLAGARFT